MDSPGYSGYYQPGRDSTRPVFKLQGTFTFAFSILPHIYLPLLICCQSLETVHIHYLGYKVNVHICSPLIIAIVTVIVIVYLVETIH